MFKRFFRVYENPMWKYFARLFNASHIHMCTVMAYSLELFLRSVVLAIFFMLSVCAKKFTCFGKKHDLYQESSYIKT